MSDPLEKIYNMLEARRRWNEQIDQLTDDGADAIETAILMDLWRDLGDHTATYWEAMVVVTGFVNALKAVRKELPPENRAALHALKALASCVFCDAEVGAAAIEMRECFEKENGKA